MDPAGGASAQNSPPDASGREADTSALPAVRGGPKLIVPSVILRCPAGHELELPAEYAARRDVFCPQCRRAFSPDAAAVSRARRKVAVGMPGRLRRWRRKLIGVQRPEPVRLAGAAAAALPTAPAQPPATSVEAAVQASSPGGVRAADEPLIQISPRAFNRLVSASGWAVSCAIHAVLLAAVALLGVALGPPPEEPEVILISNIQFPEERRRPEQPRRREVFTNRGAENRPDPEPEMAAPEELPRFDPEAAQAVREPDLQPGGRDPAIDDLAIPPATMSGPRRTNPARPAPIGLGPGEAESPAPGAGPSDQVIGARSSAEGRLDAARKGGGGEDTESAVEKALEWLAARQGDDGSWSVAGGRKAGRTELRDAQTGAVTVRTDFGPNPHDLAASGLATLAFLGAGYDGRQGKHRETVAKAVDFLLAEQKPTGCWAKVPETQDMHVQGIATLALVEAYLAAPQAEGAEKLKAAAGRGVQFIVDAQYPYSGWGYSPYAVRAKPEDPPRTVDRVRSGGYVEQSVVIWNGMALKAARTAGIAVDGRAFSGMTRWLDDGQGADGNYAYSGSLVGDRIVVRDKRSSPCMAAAALMMRLWTGKRPDENSSKRTAAIVLDLLERNKAVAEEPRGRTPAKTGPDLYFLHHGSIALFQMGGDRWVRWNRIMKPMVLKSQAADGSWAPSTYANGPVLATALGALTLESYYRYSPLYR